MKYGWILRGLLGVTFITVLFGCSSQRTVVDNSNSTEKKSLDGGKAREEKKETTTHAKADSISKHGAVAKKESVTKEVTAADADLAALTAQGDTLFRSEKFDAALPVWMKILQKAGDDKKLICEAHYVLGNIFFHKEEYGKAEIELKMALQVDSLLIDAHLDLGLVHFVKGDYDKALTRFDKVLALAPGDSEGTYWRNYTLGSRAYEDGLSDFNLENYAKAMDHFKIAAQYLANDTAANYKIYYFLGKSCNEKFDYENALGYLNQCVALNPNCAEAYTELATLYFARRDFDKAVSYNQKAITINPNFAKAQNNLGYIYFTIGNNLAINNHKDQGAEYYAKAISLFEKALSLDPDMQGAQNNLKHVKKIMSGERKVRAFTMMQSAAKTENNAEKITQYRQVISDDPTYDDAYNNLAVAYYYSGHVDSAMAVIEKALEINPYNPQAHNNLGYMLGTAHRYDEALKHLFIAIQIKRDYFDAYFNLGYVYMWKEDFESSRKIWVELLKLNADNKPSRKGLAELERREKMVKSGETMTKIEISEDPVLPAKDGQKKQNP
jgi:tetratricopeptide (TPR) repeat protein